MVVVVLGGGSLSQIKPSPIQTNPPSQKKKGLHLLTRRRAIVVGPSALVASLLHLYNPIISSPPSAQVALAQQQQQQDELQQEEDRAVHLFQVSLSLYIYNYDIVFMLLFCCPLNV